VELSNSGRAYSDAIKQALIAHHRRDAYSSFTSGTGATAPLLVRQHFSVANEAVNLQMPAWSDYVARILEVPLSRAQVAGGFRGEIDTYALKDMIYLDSRTDPMSQIRSAARISTDSMRDFVFHVTVEGIAETVTGSAQQRKSAQFIPGILALDMNQTMHMRRPTRARVLAFFLPRCVVEAVIPDAESIHGRVVAYTTPLANLLREHLSALYRNLPAMSDGAATDSLQTCAQLILAAFQKQAHLSDSVRATARAAMLGRIKRYVREHLHSKELTPDKILGAFPLARPTLYRMFEHEGGLHAYIRNCRLRQAAEELIDAQPLPVAHMAARLGFNSHSDFTRAFRRAYGVAPLDFKAMQLEWMRG
jgi:AraC-like DNA-binding protein